MEVIGLPFLKEDQWRILWDCMRAGLYERRWFERLLVVQEVAMPNHVMEPLGPGASSSVPDPVSWIQ